MSFEASDHRRTGGSALAPGQCLADHCGQADCPSRSCRTAAILAGRVRRLSVGAASETVGPPVRHGKKERRFSYFPYEKQGEGGKVGAVNRLRGWRFHTQRSRPMSTTPESNRTPFAALTFRHAGVGKSILQKHARRVLGMSSAGGLAPLFRATAAHFGLTWNTSKSEGYRLLARLYDATPEAQTPLKVSQAKTRKGTSYEARKTKAPLPAVATDAFLSSYAWRRLRMEVLIEQGRRCQCCGATPDNGVVMHVDHIKPRRLFPELALEKSNLQVLCEVCNHGKGNWDQTDWKQEAVDLAKVLPMWSKRVN